MAGGYLSVGSLRSPPLDPVDRRVVRRHLYGRGCAPLAGKCSRSPSARSAGHGRMPEANEVSGFRFIPQARAGWRRFRRCDAISRKLQSIAGNGNGRDSPEAVVRKRAGGTSRWRARKGGKPVRRRPAVVSRRPQHDVPGGKGSSGPAAVRGDGHYPQRAVLFS